ncbi:MAG: hypothetical protein ACN4E2_03875 [Nitrospinota bacterium]
MEKFIYPSFDEWEGLLTDNLRLQEATFNQHPELETIRHKARSAAIIEAVRTAKTIGIDSPNPLLTASPIIGTGHQPYFFHAGVISKNILIKQFAEKVNGTTIFINIDSDQVNDGTIFLPNVDSDQNVGLRSEKLFDFGGYDSFEDIRKVDTSDLIGKFDQFIEAMKKDQLPYEPFERWVDKIKLSNLEPKEPYLSLMVKLRNLWDEEFNQPTLELFVSTISAHTGFKLFATLILKKIKLFHTIYNSELDSYRKLKKLRYKANPFPNLKEIDGRLFETPFWLKEEGEKRSALYIDDKQKLIRGSDESLLGGVEEMLDGNFPIRPKAILLTAYIRLFLTDLFVHGIGGAKYDTITDQIISRFFNIDSPRFVSVTVSPDQMKSKKGENNQLDAQKLPNCQRGDCKIVETQLLDCKLSDCQRAIEDLKTRLRQIDYAPESFKNELNSVKFNQLIEDKKRLIEEISLAKKSEKRVLASQISSINKKLSSDLAIVRNKIESVIENVEKLVEANKGRSYREYPYFLYNRSQIADKLLKSTV